MIPTLAPKDPSVALRIVDDRREHRGGRPAFAVRANQRVERVRLQERDVARQQYDRALRAGQERFGLEERVTRAELRLLRCKAQAQPFRERLFDGARLVTHDYRDGSWVQSPGGTKNVFDEGKSTRPVEHLWDSGFHSRALPGREHDDMDVGHSPQV
jgi:hypothetical protein